MKRLIKHGWMAAGLSLGLLILTGGVATAQEKGGGTEKAQAPAALPDLKLIWKQGQVSRYELQVTTSTERQVSEQPEKIKSGHSEKMKVVWKVEEADPAGGGKGSMTFEDFTMEVTDFQGAKTQLNSKTDDVRFEGHVTVIKAFIGEKVTLTVNSAGDVIKAEGFEGIRKKAGRAGGYFSEAFFKELGTNLAVVARGQEKPEAGAKWDRKYDWTHGLGNLHFQSQYTLVGMEKVDGANVAVIKRESAITFSPDPAKLPKEETGLKVSIELSSGTEKVKILFDPTRNENVGLTADYSLGFQITTELDGRTVVQRTDEKIQHRVVRLKDQ